VNMRYYEWASQPNRRKGRMVSETELHKIIMNMKDPGYSSVYSFSEEDAKKIKESECSKGLNMYEVASPYLYIDIDSDTLSDSDAKLACISSQLQRNGLGHHIWFSGSKGYHVILEHQYVCDINLPYSQYHFLEEVLKLSHYDKSLYQHGRLISLPGRIHPKTGKRKYLLTYINGGSFTLDIVKKPEPKYDFSKVSIDLHTALTGVAWLAKADPREGSRHTAIWGAARDCKASGMDYDTTCGLLLEVNRQWSKPKHPEEVRRAIKQAYEER
jgi:hypothetical protein